MTTTDLSPVTTPGSGIRRAERMKEALAEPIRPIPLTRVVAVELRKMFDTRSGFWLMMSIVITSVLATGAVIIWAPDDELKYSTFATAIGFPMAVILPMIAVLSVTSEWSQRTGLTSFTLVPHRSRVILAKFIGTVGVAVVSMLLAMVIGVAGNIIGSKLAGAPISWDSTAQSLSLIVLANVLGMLIGFMLGVVTRNSAGAIVGYFVLTLVLPPLTQLLATAASWFDTIRPWVDFNYAQTVLFNDAPNAEQWANLGVASLIWLVIPTLIGLRLVLRSEVK
jgi:ABC-2 type transport system permease protein